MSLTAELVIVSYCPYGYVYKSWSHRQEGKIVCWRCYIHKSPSISYQMPIKHPDQPSSPQDDALFVETQIYRDLYQGVQAVLPAKEGEHPGE